MTSLQHRAMRMTAALLFGALVAGCGGGSAPDVVTSTRSDLQSRESDVGVKTIQAAALNAGGTVNTVIIRAHADVAGGIGAVMQLHVDGELFGSQEVQSSVPTDYVFAVPMLKPGSKVDIAYTNDGKVGAADRNLYIVQVTAGNTALLPTAPGVSVDRGAGDASFDGVDVLPGQVGLYWPAALRMTWPEPNLTSKVTVRASALAAGNVGANMVVRVGGTVVGTVVVSSSTPADYSFNAPAYSTGSQVDVAFTNAGVADGVARALNVHYLMAGTTVLRPTDAGVKFDAGAGLAAYDWVGQTAGLVTLTADGALRAAWPAPNMTDTLTIRAQGTLAESVGPIVQVLADGVALGSVEVRSTTPVDFSLPALPLRPGQRIEVRPTNLGSSNGQTRNLNIAYAISGKTVLLANASSLDAPWPEPNLTDTLNIRARSDLADGIGAIVQVLVDGVMVGSTEVKSTVFADHRFAVPAMTAGRKIDVVYTNDSGQPGRDRNLYIAYLTTSNTVVLPSAPGNTLDRGNGAAALDGNDVVAGTGSIYWGGALRMSWPAANITDTLTVRASATPAGGVGALMMLWIDGVAVSSVEVRSPTPVDYRLPSTTLRPGSKIAITFANRGTVDGIDRALNIQYAIAGSTFLTPTTAGATYASGDLSASWPAPNITDTLTVRAYADIAGGVGAWATVQVDGVRVAQFEVASILPQDYSVGTPTLKPGSKVDIAYTNDGKVGAADRNLYIVQVTAGNTALLPTAPGVSVDRGAGDASFDGVDVLPGQVGLYWPAALRMTWPEPNLTSKVTVRASALAAGNVGANMVVRVGGTVVGTVVVSSSTPADYSFNAPAYSTGSQVDVAFTNAGVADGVARALNVHYLMAGTTVLRPTDAGVKFDAGAGLAAYDWVGQTAGLVTLTADGALRAAWPAPNMTDTLTIRAQGTLAESVGPIVQVLADGVALGSVEVRSTTPVDFSLPALPLRPGQRIEVRPTNLGSSNGQTRNLNIAYAISGKTVLLANASSLDAPWPEPNLTDTLNIRARSDLADGIGAIVQVLVDGVMVGSTEVKSTVFADHRFAVPAMTAGRKIDVVYTNDSGQPGRDRNLYIAYLTTSNTVVLPSAPGNTLDRGNGAAALDGNDVVAGTGSIYWGGALRMSWPAANITDTLTVRASATPAGGVGALMMLWIDGVAVSSVEVRSPTPVDYRLPSTTLRPGSKIAITFANRGTVDGIDRALNIQYAIAGSTFLTPTTAGATYASGDLSASWPAPNITDTLTVRAYADIAGGVGAIVQLRVNGVIVGSREINSATPTDYAFKVPTLTTGSKIDLIYQNDGSVNGVDRNLYVQYLRTSTDTLLPFAPGAVFDAGAGEAALDGVGTSAASSGLFTNGALRMSVQPPVPAYQAAQFAAARFLMQSSFGPTLSEIDRVAAIGPSAWIDAQMAMPASADMVAYVQSRFDLGDSYRPGGTNYTAQWVSHRFWRAIGTQPDQLRRRVGFALHQILMASQSDTNLHGHVRAYASYVDTLNKHAFGNYRELLEDIALSPAMGIYLSHMRNRPESPSTGRMPDENFARELMQLFTIGLHELNQDGSPKRDALGEPIDTYSNADVMALARVFSGWSWALPAGQRTEHNFRYGIPDYSAANDQRIDLQRMVPYPGMHSTSEKRLFVGKAMATVLPAGNSAEADVKAALDTLFNHPNVGPFVGRQLIQRLVTSNPSPAYIARVAAAFNNNGKGQRGDLGAVVRAILLDPEAMSPPVGSIGKLREPMLRLGNWLRSFDATSATGTYAMFFDLDPLGQRQLGAPTVFGYFRPGYVPPNTTFAATGTTVPEMQIVNEATTVQWVNLALRMADGGLGWTSAGVDVVANLQPLTDLASAGQFNPLIDRLNLLLYAGRMSASLKQDLFQAMVDVPGIDLASHRNRARVAMFLAIASPEYLITH